MSSMQNRSRMINRLALVLLSIVVLELILIGDPVQPVKAIKKKIALKKLKKILPLLALIKPKKKLILVPIPIPMFKKPGYKYPYATSQQNHQMMGTGQPMTADGTAPMSFVMEPNLTGGVGPPGTMQLVPMSMVESSNVFTPASLSPAAAPMTMMMPSMTMTISSDGGGATMSAIELSATNRPMASANASSGALMASSRPNKYHEQQQVQENFDNEWANNEAHGGEYYYSSPWSANRQPLTSPAKLLRGERPAQTQPPSNESTFRTTSQPQQSRQNPSESVRGRQSSNTITMRPTFHQRNHFRPANAQPSNALSGRLKQPLRPQQQQQQQPQFPAPMPVIIIKNQWTPSKATQGPSQQLQQKSRRQNDRIQQEYHHQQQHIQQQHLTPLQEQQISQALEYEELIPIGPPQLMPIYQTPNGRLHMTPPTPTSRPPSDTSSLQSSSSDNSHNSFDHEHEHEQEHPTSQSTPNQASVATQTSTPAQNYNDSTNSEVQTTNGRNEPAAARFQPMTTPAGIDQDEVQTVRPPQVNTQPTGVILSPSNSARVTLKGKQQQPNETKRHKQPVVASGY